MIFDKLEQILDKAIESEAELPPLSKEEKELLEIAKCLDPLYKRPYETRILYHGIDICRQIHLFTIKFYCGYKLIFEKHFEVLDEHFAIAKYRLNRID